MSEVQERPDFNERLAPMSKRGARAIALATEGTSTVSLPYVCSTVCSVCPSYTSGDPPVNEARRDNSCSWLQLTARTAIVVLPQAHQIHQHPHKTILIHANRIRALYLTR